MVQTIYPVRHVLALLLFSSALSVHAENAGETVIEEIVVTGSYLKKTTADSPSPLSVITKADIDELGVVDIKDVINLDKLLE